MTCGQLRDIKDGFIQTGFLANMCAKFNKANEAAIKAGKEFEMRENLHALNRFVVKPATAADGDLPAGMAPSRSSPRVRLWTSRCACVGIRVKQSRPSPPPCAPAP